MKKLSTILIILLCLCITCSQSFAYSTSSKQAIIYFNNGVKLLNNQQYDQAKDAFIRASESDPNLVETYYNLASIYLMQKKIDDAYQAYSDIVRLEPKNYGVLLEMAKIQYNKKNYSHCVKLLNNIPSTYRNYHQVERLKADATSFFEKQKEIVERSKAVTANIHERTILDNINAPAGVVADSKGFIYVASYSDNAILKINPKDKSVSIVLRDSYLKGPIGLAIDKLDNIYIANYDANNILKLSSNGKASVFMDNINQPYFISIVNDVLYATGQGDGIVVIYNLATNL